MEEKKNLNFYGAFGIVDPIYRDNQAKKSICLWWYQVSAKIHWKKLNSRDWIFPFLKIQLYLLPYLIISGGL